MSKLQFIIVGIVLLFSVFLRFHNYTEYPQRGATSDEYTYSFLGVSLLTQGKPISWSAFQAYGKVEDKTIRGIYFPIVQPYFDHPPLNGLVVGAWALLFGENTFEKISLSTIRMVPIFLATISSLLLFLIAKKLYDYTTAMWALLIFVTTPLFVMNMRIVVAENLLTVFFLTTIYLFVRNKKISTTVAVLLGIIAGLSLWTKILGVSVFIFIIYLCIAQKVKVKQIVVLGISFGVFILGFLLYAYTYNWELFWAIQKAQAGREVGPLTLLLITSTPIIVNKVYQDFWYYFGFFSLLYSFINFEKNKLFIIPSLIYTLLLLTSLTEGGISGWYFIPFFPFLSLATAVFLQDMLKSFSFGFVLFPLFISQMAIKYLFQEPFGLTQNTFRVFIVMFMGPFMLLHVFNKKTLFQRAGSFLFYLFILCNIIITYQYIHPA